MLRNKRPIFAVECKTGDKQLSKHIPYFKQRTAILLFYQVHLKNADYGDAKSGRVLPFTTFCKKVGLVWELAYSRKRVNKLHIASRLIKLLFKKSFPCCVRV